MYNRRKNVWLVRKYGPSVVVWLRAAFDGGRDGHGATVRFRNQRAKGIVTKWAAQNNPGDSNYSVGLLTGSDGTRACVLCAVEGRQGGQQLQTWKRESAGFLEAGLVGRRLLARSGGPVARNHRLPMFLPGFASRCRCEESQADKLSMIAVELL